MEIRPIPHISQPVMFSTTLQYFINSISRDVVKTSSGKTKTKSKTVALKTKTKTSRTTCLSIRLPDVLRSSGDVSYQDILQYPVVTLLINKHVKNVIAITQEKTSRRRMSLVVDEDRQRRGRLNIQRQGIA